MNKMGRPIKIKAKFPRIKIVNRCIFCGAIIPTGSSICGRCARKMCGD